MPKPKRQASTKLSAEEIFDAIRDPGIENMHLADGVVDGTKVAFVVSERKNGDVVPLALILDAKAFKTLREMEEIVARESDEDDEDGDEDDGDDDEDDEDEDFEP